MYAWYNRKFINLPTCCFLIVIGLRVLNRNTSISIDDITGEKETPKYYRGLKAIRELAGKNKDMIDLMQIRDSENMDMFRSFVHFGLQHIKSKIDWQYERQDVTISNFFSVYDESFVILLMMNSWKEFEMMARGERIPRGDRKTLFTNCIVDEIDEISDSSTNGSRGIGTNSVSVSSAGTSSVVGNGRTKMKKTKGWSVRGIERYNVIIKHVYQSRCKQEQKDMENSIMMEYSTLDESRKRKRKQDETIEEDVVVVDAIDAYNFDPTGI